LGKEARESSGSKIRNIILKKELGQVSRGKYADNNKASVPFLCDDPGPAD
jgi:hypothetical protein